jgi:GNAT superfamily N-acetyltransferase
MRIVAWDRADVLAAKACNRVVQAVMAADDPLGPPMSERTNRTYLKSPGEPAQAWFVPGDTPGSARGFYLLQLPDRDNRHRGRLYLEVHPEQRRRRIGVALLRHAARQAAEDGRSVLTSHANLGSAGEAFAKRMGAKPGLMDARRVLVLGRQPAGRVGALRESAARPAAGYSLVPWTGRTPDRYLAGLAAVFNAMSDAPRDPGHEPQVWDAQRVRERVNGLRAHYGLRTYAVVARHDASGELAALTEVAVDPADPGWGHQMLTGVTREHRGHRLGLLVKIAMAEWLTAAEPTLERINTWNAESNRYMIAVNEALGYTIAGRPSGWWKLDVAAALSAQALAERTGVAG